MNRTQKNSWMTVICIGIALIISTLAVIILYFIVGFPRAWVGLSFMGLSGFGGLGSIIFKKDAGAITCDERDYLINMKAARAGFAISYGVFGLLCMGIWYYYRFHSIDTIKIEVLPWLFGAAGITAFFIHALTILILYGKDNKAIEGGAV